MKVRMQKTSAQVNGYPRRDRTASEWYEGVQIFLWMTEDNIVEVPFDKEHLLESILNPDNLNKAYLSVVRNKGCGGIDRMSCEQLLPWLLTNKNELIPIYERQFSTVSFGFRPKRSCHNALRKAQKIISDGYIYVVDLDLERFFDTVSHSKLIEIISRTITDGRVVSLIHKYLHSGVINCGLFESSEEGTSQGPLSPLLGNVMLNELDKELASRGLPFVRYADNALIFCKSKRAALRVRESITRFMEGKLHLKVNREKTTVVVCARSEISRALLLCNER